FMEYSWDCDVLQYYSRQHFHVMRDYFRLPNGSHACGKRKPKRYLERFFNVDIIDIIATIQYLHIANFTNCTLYFSSEGKAQHSGNHILTWSICSYNVQLLPLVYEHIRILRVKLCVVEQLVLHCKPLIS
ncbi:MAG: hypothetical protein ACI4UL_05640, partial [Muribaculaceae bacterium]